MTDLEYMMMTLEMAKKSVAEGQSPFGATIVRDDQVLVCTHNIVMASIDPTAHAEVTAIRMACQKLRTIDLSGCTIYSSTEPCPMCFSAIHWSKISRIVFGASIADADAAGFSELHISNETMKKEGGATLEIVRGVLRDECAAHMRSYSGKTY